VRITVVVPTTNRADLTRRTVERLGRQVRQPDRILVVAVTAGDVEGLAAAVADVQIELAPRGLCSQRNRALQLVRGDADLIVFFDDDFVPCETYLANAERFFEQHEDIVGATGRILADGARGEGIDFEAAVALTQAHRTPAEPRVQSMNSLYGCNMVIRASATEGLWFDENLPLYGWQEDIDFTYRLGARGRLAAYEALAGVHMGHKGGRSAGKRLGYSQIANPIYLLGKRSMPRDLAARLLTRNIASNVLRSFRPEPHVDRRGRLAGNLLAIRDLLIGRLHPQRIMQIQ